jgi:hypothetical protein
MAKKKLSTNAQGLTRRRQPQSLRERTSPATLPVSSRPGCCVPSRLTRFGQPPHSGARRRPVQRDPLERGPREIHRRRRDLGPHVSRRERARANHRRGRGPRELRRCHPSAAARSFPSQEVSRALHDLPGTRPSLPPLGTRPHEPPLARC